jgi:hypothetical protein
MSGLMLFLLGLLILVVLLVLLGYRRFAGSGCVPLLAGIFLLAGISIGGWELYQCEFNSPDQIKLAGHITDVSNPRPNNYLVILYLETEEIARDMTRLGQFDPDRKDAQNDGYFELTFPNEYELTRCEMPMKFRLSPLGNGLPAFLWFRFEDLEAGATRPILIEERSKKYTLVVLPESVDHLPAEIANRTYLDRNGKVTINVPIKTYWTSGPSLHEISTAYTVHPEPAMKLLQGGLAPFTADVRNAWVVDGPPREIAGPTNADEYPLDINNCTGSTPIRMQVIKRLTFVHEVEFEAHASLNFDLGQAALIAGPSLGFSHGQIGVEEIPIAVDVPAGAHTIYMVYWHDLWKTGAINMAVGQGVDVVPFRARMGIQADVQPYPVHCP